MKESHWLINERQIWSRIGNISDELSLDMSHHGTCRATRHVTRRDMSHDETCHMSYVAPSDNDIIDCTYDDLNVEKERRHCYMHCFTPPQPSNRFAGFWKTHQI